MNINSTSESNTVQNSGMDTIPYVSNIHLNLKSVWFDLILSGEKKEEYREIKPYWAFNLLNKISKNGVNKIKSLHFWKGYLRQIENNAYVYKFADKNSENYIINAYGFKDYKTITFSNGYSKNRRQFVIELLSIEINTGKPEWGAIPNQKYFVLKLGKIISSNCC